MKRDENEQSQGAPEASPPGANGRSESDAGEESMRLLLRAAEPAAESAPDVLRGVQKKLRERSGGKFYAEGWSTAKHPPIATYLVTSALMLVIVLAVYALISPLVGNAVPVKNEPAPVQVLPPAVIPSSGR